MLVKKQYSVGRRIATVLVGTALITVLFVLLPIYGASRGWWGWPQPSSPLGVSLGLMGGLIILFEMALYPRKLARRYKGFPQALWSPRLWLRLHVGLGLLCFPIIVIHAGYGFGGPLTRVTLILFLLTIVSGVWGLVVQQWLPQKLLNEYPEETVASQVDTVAGWYVGRRTGVGHTGGRDRSGEAYRLLDSLIQEPAEVGELLTPVGTAAGIDDSPEAGAAPLRYEPLVTGLPAQELEAFLIADLIPYLESGAASGSLLVTRAASERRFARLREKVPVDALPALDRLEVLAHLRRTLDDQVRINRWLHSWIPVHLLLSVAMTGLMLVHAIRALKYW